MPFLYGSSLRGEVETIGKWRRRRELADNQFRFHQEPERAARATLSMRSAFPWMSPNLAAQLGAYGVDPEDPALFDVAAVAVQRRQARGWESPGQRRRAAEVRNVITPWRSLDRTRTESLAESGLDPVQAAAVARLETENAVTPDDMMLGPTQPEDIGVGDVYVGGTGPGLEQAAIQSDRERAAFQYARVPSVGQFQNLSPGVADTAQGRNQIIEMSRQYRQILPSVDETLRHIRRGGLMYEGIPLPSGDVSADDLRDVYLGPARDDIRQRLADKRNQIESQWDDPGDMPPTVRQVYDGINLALNDVIDPALETVGRDLEFEAAGIDFDLNLSDIVGVPYDAARGAIRNATMALDLLWQAGQARFRQTVHDPTNPAAWAGNAALAIPTLAPSAWNLESLGRADLGLHETAAQTDLGIVLGRLADGQDVDTGSGFFVTPHSGVGEERRRNEIQYGDIGGHVITVGRWTADQIPGVEPNTDAFNIVSGAVDLAYVLAEPGGALLDVATRSAGFRRALANAGGYTATRSVRADQFDSWLRSTDGARVIQTFADLPDDQAIYRLWQESSHSGGMRRMPRWAFYALGRQEGTEAVESMLRNLTGMGYASPGVPTRPYVAPAPAFRRRLSQSRWAIEMPETGARALDIYDADAFVGNLESSLRNARVGEDEIASLVGRAYGAYDVPTRVRVQQLERDLDELRFEAAGLPDSPEVAARFSEITDEINRLRPGMFVTRPAPHRNELFQVWEDAQTAKRDRLIAAGVDKGVAQDLTTLREVGIALDARMVDDMDAQGRYFLSLVTDDGNAANIEMWERPNGEHLVTVDGEPVVDASSPSFAHMSAEHLTRYLPLEDDYRQLGRLTRNVPGEWFGRLLANPRNAREAPGQLRTLGSSLAGPLDPRNYATVAETFMDKIWKPSRLLRPAWPIRVVGEEQFRIAAAGLDSMVTHPLSYVALVMGMRRDGRFGKMLDTMFEDVGGRYAVDALGESFSAQALEAQSELAQALNRGQSSWAISLGAGSNGRFVPASYYLRDPKLQGSMTNGYYSAWADLLARAHSDDIVRRIAQTQLGMESEAGYRTVAEIVEAGGGAFDNVDDLRRSADQNIIARTRADLADSHPELLRRGEATWAARYQARPAGQMHVPIHNWDDYVESLQIRIKEMTGGDEYLAHTVARGRFGDGLRLDSPNAVKLNPDAVRRLEEVYSDVAPPVIPGDAFYRDQVIGRGQEGLDRVLEQVYALLGAIPTDRLSRSPAFRQFYWRRVQELMPFANEAAQREILENAGDLGAKTMRGDGFHLRLSAYMDNVEDSVVAPTSGSLQEAATRGTGELDAAAVDELAKAAALDNTRWLLYDVHKRGMFMDAMRIIFPFGEAWKEVITRWAQLTAQRPGTVIQRSTQIVQATGSPQPFEDIVDDPSQHGFIFENATGETVFTYPGSEWFTGGATGVPVELTGSFNGLTLMSSVLPGIGPAIQIPASFSRYLRNNPEMEGIRNALFPYGMGENPTESWASAGMAVADAVLSPAAQRFVIGAFTTATGHGPADDRLFMNSAFDVMRYLVSTGEYTTDSPEAISRTINDSVRRAGMLYVIRGIAGMTLPSAPIPEFQVEGNGGLLMLRALTERYRQLQQEDFSTASQRFMEQYGENLELVMQSKTVPTTAMLPVTKEADRWVQSNPDVRDTYGLTFGLWAPAPEDPEDEDFDYDAYNRYASDRALQVLGRELDLRDLVYLANDRAASIEYRAVEAELLANPEAVTEEGNLTEEAQRYLSTEVTPDLRNRYPGFGSDGLERGPSNDDLRDTIGRPGETETEVRLAARDDRIAEPIRDALAQFLEAHDSLFGQLDLDPDRWGGATTYYESTGTRPMRDWMRSEVFPNILEGLPERYRNQWDIIVDRLLDRVMLSPWLEEPDSEMEMAA